MYNIVHYNDMYSHYIILDEINFFILLYIIILTISNVIFLCII